jgi:hypothetical protein
MTPPNSAVVPQVVVRVVVRPAHRQFPDPVHGFTELQLQALWSSFGASLEKFRHGEKSAVPAGAGSATPSSSRHPHPNSGSQLP